MGDIVKRGGRYYVRWIEGYKPAVNVDGTPKLWESGPKKGQPKVDANGKPLLEPIRKTKAAKGATTKDHAKKILAAIELRITQGRVGIEEPTPEETARKSITVRELGARFGAEYSRPKLKDPEKYRRRARGTLEHRVYPSLGDKPAASVTPDDVERMRDELTKQGAAGSSVMQALATLSKMYNWSRKRALIDCANPVVGCERPRVKEITDFLSHDECADLLDYAKTLHGSYVAASEVRDLYPLIATALHSGMRKGELFGVVRYERVTSKSGKARHVAINPELAVILREWKERWPSTKERLVFPVNGRMGDEGDTLCIDAVLAAAGCNEPEDKPWHLLRHTFASHFMMADGSILTLKELLGHADIKMTMRYAHLAPDFMAAEVARMSFARRAPAGVTRLDDERRRRLIAALESRPEAVEQLLASIVES